MEIPKYIRSIYMTGDKLDTIGLNRCEALQIGLGRLLSVPAAAMSAGATAAKGQ
jgi:hypothetical protein